jgi:PAS domain S-box-containing protein
MAWLSDAQGKVLHVNEAWRTATGLEVADFGTARAQRLVYPDDRGRLTSDSNLFAGHAHSCEYRLLFANGGYRWVTERIHAWRDRQHRLVGYFGTAIDIQSQKEHEQRLAVIALRQTSLTHFSRVALVQTSLDEVNREALRLFCENLGLPAALIVLGGDSGPVLAATRGLDDLAPPLVRALDDSGMVLGWPADEEDFPLEPQWLTSQGWTDAVAVPLDPQSPRLGQLIGLRREAGGGAAIGPLHYARDLAGILAIAHERDRAQGKLRESEARALQAQKMEAVGLLAGGVAHDFNNLLTAIRCFADLLREDLADPAQRSKVDDILHASSRASHLVRQLLAFSRQEITQQEDLDLNQLLDDLRGFIRSLLSEHVRIEFEPSERAAWCRVDRKQVEQVLFNLCLNARDVMPTDGVLTLRVSHHEAEGRRFVRLSVQDTGPGIPPEAQARLFQPFFTTKARGRGTGLGLATCLNIAHANGGTLGYETRPGAGTTFHLDVPEIDDPVAAYTFEEETRGECARARLMLVEDDELVRAVTQMLAESLGHEVIAFPNGIDACRHAEEHGLEDVDVLITDIVMPGMNGRELAARLLALKPALPVLYMSGYVDDPTTQEAMAQPGVIFLSKPFSSDDFAAKLEGVLRGLRAQA